MNVETSVAIIAVCFLIFMLLASILLICLIKVMIKTSAAVGQLTPTIAKTMDVTHQIAAKIKTNIDLADPLFSSIHKAGQQMEKLSTEIEEETQRIHLKAKVHYDQWIEWIGLGIILWQKIKKGMEK